MDAEQQREPPILVADHTPLKASLPFIPTQRAKTRIIHTILKGRTDER